MEQPVVYALTEEQKMYFSSVLLLDIMINDSEEFPTLLLGDNKTLEPVFLYMIKKGWVDVVNKKYVASESGRMVLLNHKEKLVEFRTLYKIYSAVNLNEGTFAYEKYFDFDTDEEFEKFINDPQFEDMRVAVCEFKKINPLEVIFLEMADNGSFNLGDEDWIFNLVSGQAWEDLVDIANSNIHMNQLTEYDDLKNVTFTGEQIMEIMVRKGTEISIRLLKEQQEFDAQNVAEEDEEVVETITTTTTTTTEDVVDYVDDPYYDYLYYDPYYNPYYISPCWGIVWY